MSEVQLKNRLFTANAVSTGGRNGNVATDDQVINVNLSIPKAMGGPGKPGTTTPEDLFAAGYAACFGSACEFVAKSMLKLNPTTIRVTCQVTIGQIDPAGFGLETKMQVGLGGLTSEQAHQLVEKAHQICPYSNATRGNMKVTLEVSLL